MLPRCCLTGLFYSEIRLILGWFLFSGKLAGMARANISDDSGLKAVREALALLEAAQIDTFINPEVSPQARLWSRTTLADWGSRKDFLTITTASRYLLQITSELFPGRAVELRIPPAGAVQIISGVKHRRGTPPAVVELAPVPWITLACGLVTWEQLFSTPLLNASGEQADLREIFPLQLPL